MVDRPAQPRYLITMPYTVVEFEATPNPNAMKCWLDKPISDRPRSFLNREMAEDEPIARALFEKAGATCVLFNGEWVTVNKPDDAEWSTVKAHIREILRQTDD